MFGKKKLDSEVIENLKEKLIEQKNLNRELTSINATLEKRIKNIEDALTFSACTDITPEDLRPGEIFFIVNHGTIGSRLVIKHNLENKFGFFNLQGNCIISAGWMTLEELFAYAKDKKYFKSLNGTKYLEKDKYKKEDKD